MSDARLPTRLIICVDGTFCSLDGPYGSQDHNISNVYRIYASIKNGECINAVSGKTYEQRKKYVHGIGSADDIAWVARMKTGALGNECLSQIQGVYEDCCKLDHPEDEVWLFGFSRGAYVVRAVAGLLHYLRALSSAGGAAFQADYSKALRVYEKMQKQSKLGRGQIHEFLSACTRPAPKIQFVGVFDPVKAVNGQSLYDISLNDSIQHLRQALALNEDRKVMAPEYVFPDCKSREIRSLKRSFTQAWFIGAHLDIGGSAEKDGLALYPLQWMLIESRRHGLVLGFDGSFGGRTSIDNPLHVVFPKTEEHGKGNGMWSFTLHNELVVDMQDIRRVHSLERYGQRYAIQLNKRQAMFWPKKAREPFDANNELNGYCAYAPQGAIIHPSVFMLLDEYVHIALDSKAFKFQNNVERWRPKIRGKNHDFLEQGIWNDREYVDPEDPGAIRILVCGNTGVGKSTIINKVFGVDVTQSCDRERGIHNVREPITIPDRPDLILHDSGGFEAGEVVQFDAIEEFLKEKSAEVDINNRLHVIWFCIEVSSARTRQSATEKLFRTISQHAQDVPIVVVATKKDDFTSSKFQEARKNLKNQGKPVDMDACDQYAEEQFQERMQLIEREMLGVKGGRFDACIGVSKDDDATISELTQTTSRCFSHEKVRLLYIRAQVTRIDLKVDLAVTEVMRIYKHIVRAAAAGSLGPTLSTTNRMAGAISVCKAIITCFGLPTVSAEAAFEIVKATVWDDIGNNISIALAEGLATLGLLMTVGSGGLPFFLATATLNIPLVVPATTRLFLMLAADLILVLVRAFRDVTDRCIGQPQKKDIETAACAYRQICKNVHKRIVKLVPKRNVIKSFRARKVSIGFQEVIDEYRTKVMEDIEALRLAKTYEKYDSDTETITDDLKCN